VTNYRVLKIAKEKKNLKVGQNQKASSPLELLQ
jgi:hypothetical protein